MWLSSKAMVMIVQKELPWIIVYKKKEKEALDWISQERIYKLRLYVHCLYILGVAERAFTELLMEESWDMRAGTNVLASCVAVAFTEDEGVSKREWADSLNALNCCLREFYVTIKSDLVDTCKESQSSWSVLSPLSMARWSIVLEIIA